MGFFSSLFESDEKPVAKVIEVSRSGEIEKVKSLLAEGADVNVSGEDGVTALMAACENGHVGVAELLLTYGAAVNTQDKDGWSALMHASCMDRPRWYRCC